MLAPILGTILAVQQAACPPPAMMRMSEASVRASHFDLPGALESLRAVSGCEAANIAAAYVQGLLEAREAARDGGTAESLASVRSAIDALERLDRNQRGPAEVARLVLQAAAAAAQTERGEMRLYLESAVQMESVREASGQIGAPIVTAVEMAGALWLQVHGYDEAQRAYREAQRRLGPTPHVLFGLARSAARLGDAVSACAGYRALLEGWGARIAEPDEIVEARTYVSGPECRVSVR